MPRSMLQGFVAGRTPFVASRRSVLSSAQFIEAADLPARAPEVPKAQWQSAAGRRLLTPVEQAARERYFGAKFMAAMAKFSPGRRRRLFPSAA